MWLTTSFCLAVFLCSVADTECSPLPTNSEEVNSDVSAVKQVDVDAIEAGNVETRNSVNIIPSIIRSKRNFDYSDYYFGSSSEEGNGFRYLPKPVYQHDFGHYWKVHQPVTHSGFGFFPGYHHHHHHHNKKCKYPHEYSGEYDGNFSDEKSGPIGRTTVKTPPNPTQKPITSRPIETVPPTTTTTTTTEYIPVIDIRSSN